MTARVLTALFDDPERAAEAVASLQAAGLPEEAIGLAGPRAPDAPGGAEPGAAADDRAAVAAAAGATLGTLVGGGAGLLAGLGLLAVPGLGPVVAAGWLVAAVTGAGVGAAAGGLVGGLTRAGLGADEAAAYAEGVRRGGTLVTVRAQADRSEEVMSLLDAAGSIDLDERAEGWRAQGWTRSGPGSDPVADGRTAGVAPAPTQTFGSTRR